MARENMERNRVRRRRREIEEEKGGGEGYIERFRQLVDGSRSSSVSLSVKPGQTRMTQLTCNHMLLIVSALAVYPTLLTSEPH